MPAMIVPKLLFIGNQQSGTVYSAPTTEGSYAIVKSINVANTSVSGEVFSINLVPAGESVGVNNVIVGNVSLTGNNVFSYETSIVMPAGSTLRISQVSTNLTFTISGVEYVV
jgi:hypothetical protein